MFCGMYNWNISLLNLTSWVRHYSTISKIKNQKFRNPLKMPLLTALLLYASKFHYLSIYLYIWTIAETNPGRLWQQDNGISDVLLLSFMNKYFQLFNHLCYFELILACWVKMHEDIPVLLRYHSIVKTS